MSQKYKIIFLYLIFCIGTRLFITYKIKYHNPKYKQYYSIFLLLISLGFIMQYTLKFRKKALLGNEIWWDSIRPIHALLYFIGTILVYTENKNAYIPILIDTIIGLFFFTKYYSNK